MADRGPPRGRGRGGGGGGRGGGGRGSSAHSGDRGRGESPGPRGGGGGGGPPRGGSNFRGAPRGGPVAVFSHGSTPTPQPDISVTKIENDYEKNAKASALPDLARLSVNEAVKGPVKAKFPFRPGYGTRGEAVVLWANYFHLTASANADLCRYAVDITPEAKGKKAKRVIELLLSSEPFSAARNDVATDYRSTLISRTALEADCMENQIMYMFEEEDEPRSNATNYRVKLTDTGTLSVTELMRELASTNPNDAYGNKLDTIQALNIILNHYPKSQPHTANPRQNRFHPFGNGSTSFDLGAGLQAFRGYFSSVRAATSRILVNINVSQAVFYEPIAVNAMIRKFGTTYGPNPLRLNKFLRRVRVRTTHLPEKKNKAGVTIPRVKTISSLADPRDGQALEHPPRVPSYGANAKQVEFWLGAPEAPKPADSKRTGDSGTPGGKVKGKAKGKAADTAGATSRKPTGQLPTNQYISVFDFFRLAYGMTLQHFQQPVMNVGTRQNPTYLPPEVCVILPGQSSLSKLEPDQTAQMIRFAVRRPNENASSIVSEGAETIGIGQAANTKLQRFGISITAKMITVPGRTLAPPVVKYAKNKNMNSRDGSWNLAQCTLSTGTSMGSWGMLWVSDGREYYDGAKLDSCLSVFKQELAKLGISSGEPVRRAKCTVSPNGNNDAILENSLRNAANNPKRPSILLVILPNQNAPIYQQIKYLGDVKFGIQTVCCVGSKFTKDRNEQYFANVGLKFNLKRGGINHVLDQPRLGLISENKTMVVGIDVTHPSPDSASTAPSVAGMVASIDKWLGQWPAELRIQAARQERVADLDGMLTSRLKLWRTLGKHASLPENILVYRDGVSEGQYEMVVEEEYPLLREACRNLYPATDTKKGLPHISIVVVGKRHHTRFYPTKEEDASKSANPKNGTVVDRGVTEKSHWDFFLQAHNALQGTTRPAHYYVVLDEIFTKRSIKPPHTNAADALEDLTHNMCYLFGRATKAVSICPPAYYADLVCERARCYLSRFFMGNTPAQSVVSGGQDQEPQDADVTVHQSLRNTMFYI